MKNILFLVLATIISLNSIAQVTNEGKPYSWKNLDDTETFQPKVLPSFDLEAVRAEDETNDRRFDSPWRFGYMHSVDYGFNEGQWTTLDNGDRIWRILISSPGALSVNVVFDDFFMPDGGKVYLYNNEKTDLLNQRIDLYIDLTKELRPKWYNKPVVHFFLGAATIVTASWVVSNVN